MNSDPGICAALVSVIVPAYNATATILDTVTSVLNQSFSHFELLVVNDGSTDDLGTVLAPLLATDSRLRVISQPNGGLAAARNLGLQQANAPLVGFLDADDLWHPDFLQELVAALNAQPDAPFAYAGSLRIDAANNVIPALPWKRAPRHDFSGLLVLNSVGNGSAALFRTGLVRALGGYDATLRARGAQGAEDWKLCLQLAARHPPVRVAKDLVGYRLTRTSMSQADPAKQMRAVRAVMQDIKALHPGIPPRDLRHARTMMNGWLFGAFVQQRAFRALPWMLVESYVLNPLWFLNSDLRAVHWHKLASLFMAAAPRKPLAAIEQQGRRPFAFLERRDAGAQPADLAPFPHAKPATGNLPA